MVYVIVDNVKNQVIKLVQLHNDNMEIIINCHPGDICSVSLID
jgi:hypothetical protein